MPLTLADVEKRLTKAECEQGLMKYEPWKVLAIAVGITAVVFGTLGGIVGLTY